MKPLPFTSARLLAPMEGVTEPCFRELILERNGPHDLGGAFTEFARVSHHAWSRASLRAHLGARRFPQPVGLQLMGSEVGAVALTAARAVEIGAPLVDLNFGCPAPGALATCAGSALLKDPSAVERLVAAVVRAAGATPVTAKIRAGFDDASGVEQLARAAEAGGAAMLTVHCRTRAEGYCERVDWTRIARAVAAVSIPVCGNGGVARFDDFERMRRETGCSFVMVGRAALGDPWIFSGRGVTAARAAEFLLAYADRLCVAGFPPAGAAARVKQLIHFWTAGGLVGADRKEWLRIARPDALFARLRAALPEEAAAC